LARLGGAPPNGVNRSVWEVAASQKNMMSRVVLSMVLAVLPALVLAAQDPKPPAAPAVLPAGATDPAALAAPKPAPDAKAPNALPVDEKTYQIGPEDVVAISVWERPELSISCVVRSDGMITLPLINDIKAAGLTPLELKKEITDALTSQLNDPIVTVSVTGEHSKKYILYGQVKSPGAHDLITPTTVLEAISSAGGFQEFADQKHITIVRGKQRLPFNFKEVVAGKHLEQNIYLQPGDMIIVK
jgi:polysaccharide export outer membrane protein